jgi:hypothetical protein
MVIITCFHIHINKALYYNKVENQNDADENPLLHLTAIGLLTM